MPTDPRMIYMDRIPPYGSDAFMFNEQRAHVPRMRPYREATQAREYYVPQPLPVSPDYPGNDVDDRINREVLVKAGIFQGVEPSAVAALTRQLQPVTFPRGHTVFAEGEPGDRLYIIVSGKVKIGRRSPDGRENLLTIMGPSDMFGELSIFDPGPADVERDDHHRGARGVDGPGRTQVVDHRTDPRSPRSCCGYWPAAFVAPTTTWPT